MDELGTALGRFAGGLSNVDEMRSAFRDYLRAHPENREAVSRWVSDSIRIGRISPAIMLTIGDLIEPVAREGTAAESAATIFPNMSAPRKLPTSVPSPPPVSVLVQRAPLDPDATGAGLPENRLAPAEGEDVTLAAGDVLDGRYTLIEELGRGGMGSVFKARDRNREAFQDRHPYIALKVLSEEFKRHPDARMALQRETVRAQNLAHPNIVTVFDFDYDGPHAYMTMELLEGHPLEDWLQQESSASTPMARRWSIVRSIGAGLAYAHEKGVVHSDLKPGNVFLCKSGTVKVMDFGIARPLRAVTDQTDTTLFDPAERLGGLTPAYASIEQWNHEAPDPRDDIYAFACVVYYIFSGKHPFGRVSAKTAYETRLVPQRISSLTRRQWDALKRGLAFKRSDRIATVDEFLKQFAPLTWYQKHRMWLMGAAATVATISLILGAQYYRDYVEDQAVNAQLWPRTDLPVPPLTAEQRHDIDDDLYLAHESLRQAANARTDEDRSALLSTGANNLLDLLKSVRGLEPSNGQALQLTDDAAHLYENRARALLDSNRLPDALRLVLEGQRFEHTRALFEIRRTICRRNPPLCSGH
ncbi:MAG TPA: serine/threonine-protein kinase [Steroidobacteraceae bacterium]|nr:serine/threonine-protein kinase [Steroidobacteraceae bacterium]